MNLTQDFIHGSTKKSLAAMVLPLLIAMVLNMAYNLVDSLWIGNLLGETAYAALTNATPLILILNAIAMGATNGVAILLSQAVGAGDRFRSARLITTSLVVAVIFALGLTLILELTLTPLLLLLQTPSEIFSLTHSYLAIYILGYLPVFRHFKGQGSTAIPAGGAQNGRMREVVELEGGVFVRGEGRIGDKGHRTVVQVELQLLI